MYSIKQEIHATEPVSPEIPTSVFVISLHTTLQTSQAFASFSFQKFPANNLLKPEGTSKWKCAEGDKQATVTLQVPNAHFEGRIGPVCGAWKGVCASVRVVRKIT